MGKVWKAYSKEKGWSEWFSPEEDQTFGAAKRVNVFLKMEMWNLDGHWHFRKRSLTSTQDHSGSEVDLGLGATRTYVDGWLNERKPIKKLTCGQIPGAQ